MAQAPHPFLQNAPLTVGALSNPADLVLKVDSQDADWVELRLDALGEAPELEAFAARCPLPLLITARRADEGGAGELNNGARETLLRKHLGHAAAIDLELRSLGGLEGLWAEAGERKILRVASFHDFVRTPALDDLLKLIAAAKVAGADVAKLAFRILEPRDLERIIAILSSPTPLPLSVMGMGPLAPSSRLLAAQLGSVLNYGYLGSAPTAPGQWPARQLKGVLTASCG